MDTGEVVVALKQSSICAFQWSADGKTITAITPVSGGAGEGAFAANYEIYPSVHEWDWQSGTLAKALDDAPPSGAR